jgi:hypothetical protein
MFLKQIIEVSAYDHVRQQYGLFSFLEVSIRYRYNAYSLHGHCPRSQ